MKNKKMDSSQNQSYDLISFLWKNKMPLIIIGLISLLSSSIISFMIEEKFESTAALYPTKTSSVSISRNVSEDQSISKFGEDEEAEQMLQILESSSVRIKVTEKFNLLEHYDIDLNSKFKNTKLKEEYLENINFKRNNNGAVLITVLDKNPDTAALIANEITSLFDNIKNDMIHERAREDFIIKKNKLKKITSQIQDLKDTLSKLSLLGVVSNDSYRALTEGFVNAKDSKIKKSFKEKMDMTEKYGSVLMSLQIKFQLFSERHHTLEISYEQALTNVNSNISHKFIVEKAYPSEKKAYPIRWLIVIMSTFSSILFAIAVILTNNKIALLKN